METLVLLATSSGQGQVAPREPTWEVAHLFPNQGMWSEEEYLRLSADGHLVEFSHGNLEVLSMPTETHQLIVAYLYRLILNYVTVHCPGALVLFAPLRVQLWPGKFREPDVVLMLAEHADRRHEEYWEPPDLVMEVISRDYRQHDLVTKRREYAQAGIPEYWIVDPDDERITVLTLADNRYVTHDEFGGGEVATSALLSGFQVVVDGVWAAGRQ